MVLFILALLYSIGGREGGGSLSAARGLPGKQYQGKEESWCVLCLLILVARPYAHLDGDPYPLLLRFVSSLSG